MVLSLPTPESSAHAPSNAPLAPVPSRFARARSRLVCELASLALPGSMFWAHGKRDRACKRLALTFDDGPDAMTAKYLEVLSRLGVRATFFLVGENAAREPGLVREYRRRGHDIGGHGWTHDRFSNMSDERLRDELTRTEAALGAREGHARIVRPPKGAMSLRSLLRVTAAGYTTVLWSLDSDDCRGRDPRLIERRLAPQAIAPGDVVLLHELQPWTLEALPGVVHALCDDGWELVTVSELMD
jgi:peptidoglycan/xylan/chitin deacetylase (PgdA/CDA1 family)